MEAKDGASWGCVLLFGRWVGRMLSDEVGNVAVGLWAGIKSKPSGFR